ncbi:hypothetical protein DKL51_04915, partial [Micromonospora globispora]
SPAISSATSSKGTRPARQARTQATNRLDRVLALAGHSAPGGAINNYEAQQRDAALRPLTTACRQALVAACNAPLRP